MNRAYPKNPNLGICDFQNSTNPRDKPASAKRYKDVVNLGELREHLYSNCALPCDDLWVIVGRDIGKPCLLCQGPRMPFSAPGIPRMKNGFDPKALNFREFHPRNGFW